MSEPNFLKDYLSNWRRDLVKAIELQDAILGENALKRADIQDKISQLDIAIAALSGSHSQGSGAGLGNEEALPAHQQQEPSGQESIQQEDKAEESGNPYPPGTYSANAWDYERRRSEATADSPADSGTPAGEVGRDVMRIDQTQFQKDHDAAISQSIEDVS